ncbi:MAG TPA: protoglobin domain-containing protein, partial [Polyangiaceae bacterium]
MKRYVGFGAEDAACLAAFKPLAAPHFPRIAREFYDRVREHDDAHAVFTDEAQIARLQHSMERWLGRILCGIYDATYQAETAKIGRVHVRVGLPQRYMFTAMAILRIELLRIVDEQVDPAIRKKTREAVCKILDLDLGVMLESYNDALRERIERSRVQQDEDRFVLSERRYSAAVELARVAVVGLDREGNIVFFNRNAEELSGYSRDEVLGRAFVDAFIVEDARPLFAAALARAGDGTNETLDAPLRCRAGRLRDVEWQLALAPGGTAEGAVAFAMGRDRTDERALAERTRRNEKLAAIGTLAAGLAHEIRNPLNGAQLHVAFLERSLAK